jgi:uncharacterized membrane-anchored protein YhcB (DUF1043 family)
VTNIYPHTTTAHAALELQDHLLCTSTELERLQRLLADAAQTLLQHFTGADALLRDASAGAAHDDVQRHLAQAVQSLQFEDMATQLLGYTRLRIAHVADRLAALALADEDEAAAPAVPDRPNPVVQDEMDSGLIELF